MLARLRSLFQPPEVRLVVVGLDAGGKTTALYALRRRYGGSEVETTIPTIGMNVETMQLRTTQATISTTAWDVGGRSPMRPLFRHYLQNIHAVVYVIDSNDADRFEDAARELKLTLELHEDSELPVLIVANKQDLPNALRPDVLAERMGLAALLGTRKWQIVGSTASSDEGADSLAGLIVRWAEGILQPHVQQQEANEAMVNAKNPFALISATTSSLLARWTLSAK
eukprot:TRINITY_DN19185_c0_g1_i1.p1 TRINITY_DN19185_c0_g1~~TRINITY_DN19185_c0_g1_i1.p1  ORF type:complete len:237 (-),score=49.90 TRINITY_DN19185_c0_g1_i1:5-682(-)